MDNLEPLVMRLLEATGSVPQPVQSGNAYTAKLSPELAPLFQGKSQIYFTFDEEYFDLNQERGVEFVAPGYPLLDRLIRYAQTRLVVSEAALDGTVLPQLNLSSKSLNFERNSRMGEKLYLCFHFKLKVRSDEYAEELFSVWVDLEGQQVLAQPPAQLDLKPVSHGVPLDKAKIQVAWGLVQQEAQVVIQARVTQYEETANLRLATELSRLDRAGVAATERQRVIDRYRIEVNSELVFTEILHYPLQFWEVEMRSRAWKRRYQYRWDTVQRFWTRPPSCPVCHQRSFALEACDAGQHPVCPNCAASCTHCQAHHCSNHPTQPCTDCRQGHCPNCLTPCHHCIKPHCPQCQSPYPDCGQTTCNDCLVPCSVCQHVACRDHFATCHLSGKVICTQHTTRCGNCDKPTHPHRLHKLAAKDEQWCEACAVTCSEGHPEPFWLARRQAVRCSGHHSQAHLLCPDHTHYCARHPTAAPFCSSHLEACKECGSRVCADHRSVSALSGALFCSAHLLNCPRCKRSVGTSETVRVEGGHTVCQECALPCPSCAPQHQWWLLDDLKPCPHCVQEGLRRGAVVAQPSPNLLKRTYHYLLRCPEHRVVCHVCSRPGCTDHVRPCPECAKPTCPDDLLMTVEGRRVCRGCGHQCKECGSQKAYLKASLAGCGVCAKPLCGDHRTTCQSCLCPTCSEHHKPCKLCHAAVCANCAKDGCCPACSALQLVGTLPPGLPLSAPAQQLHVLIAQHIRPDGTKRVHLIYYPEFKSLLDRARSLLNPPAARLDVFEERQGKLYRLHTSILSKGHPKLPSYDFWQNTFGKRS